MVKNLPTMQETQVQSLGQEDPLEKGMATHSIFLPGEFHGQRSLAGSNPQGHRVRHDWVTKAFIFMDTEDTYKNQWVRILQILIGPLPHGITTKDIPTTFYVASC